jgi:hypothetical protein
MKDNSFAALLIGVLALGALVTASLSFVYVTNAKKLRTLQFQAAVINQNRAIIRDLVAESVEYSKRNPAMEPIIESVGIKLKGAVSQPNSKLPTKTK